MVKSPMVAARVTGAGNRVGAKRRVFIVVIDGGRAPRLVNDPHTMRGAMSRLIVVVPCYNEEKRLDVEAFRAHRGADFLFVNDGSRDGTLRLLGSLRDSDPSRFAVLALERNS